MDKLKLHQAGKSDFLKSLMNKYDNIRRKVINNEALIDAEKETELKKVNVEFEREKKDIYHRLF